MRNAIYEYLEPDIKSKKELWDSAVFVFDTNVLLNLYRYSQNTRKELIEAISSFQDRVWMPHHIATEFMKNRNKIIFETIKSFESLKEMSDEFVESCMKSIKLKEENPEIVELKSILNSWLEKHIEENLRVNNPSNDEILNKVLELFEDKVGEVINEEKMEEISNEGEKRFKDKIPPGYKDGRKDENGYGDFIIWREIIEYSQNNKKDIILITQDRKEDWWNICCGKAIGPRVELRKEFRIETQRNFNMYTMDSFIEIYSENKGTELDQSVINEVNTISIDKWIINNSDKYMQKNVSDINFNNKMLGEKYINYFLKKELDKEQLFNARKEIEICQNRIKNKMNTIISIERKYKIKEMPQHVKEQLENTENNMNKLEFELLELEDCYSKLLETIQ